MPASMKEELARRGHRIVPSDRPMFGFGGAQLIHRFDDGYCAGPTTARTAARSGSELERAAAVPGAAHSKGEAVSTRPAAFTLQSS